MRATATVALVLGALALTRIAISTSTGADLLTPSPERTAQSFVTSVATRRPDQAQARLTTNARHEWSTERLRRLHRAWREGDGDYRMREGDASRHGDRVELRARIDTARRGTVERLFILEREAETAFETALWKIASIADD